METIQHTKKLKMFYLGIKALAVFIFILTIVAYFIPTSLINDIYEFEQHHFFLFCFISLSIFFFFLRLYISLSQKDGKLNRELTKMKKTFQEKQFKHLENKIDLHTLVYQSEDIDKKDIAKLEFESNDVLQSNDDVLIRERDLNKAMVLGNSYKHKVKIFFRDLKSFKKVETTVWFVDDKHVALKEGVILPKKAIYKIIV
jgi:hypothetical protein